MHAGPFGVENAGIEQPALPGGTTIDDHAPEVAQTTHAFGRVLAPEHFKDNVHAFAVRKVANSFLVILRLVIDRVLQAEFFYAPDLFLRRGSPVHFYAENFANLDRCRAHTSCRSMDQHARAFRRLEYSCFPICE